MPFSGSMEDGAIVKQFQDADCQRTNLEEIQALPLSVNGIKNGAKSSGKGRKHKQEDVNYPALRQIGYADALASIPGSLSRQAQACPAKHGSQSQETEELPPDICPFFA
eukprot:1159442-Pelagomonas_calceolata.AAC.1